MNNIFHIIPFSFQDYVHKETRTITVVVGSTIAGAILVTVVALLVWWFYRRQQQKQFVSLNPSILYGGEQHLFALPDMPPGTDCPYPIRILAFFEMIRPYHVVIRI